MKILFLCKRQYTGRDLLDDRYGRLWELPVGLARLGHEVRVLATSYRRRGVAEKTESGVVWQSVDALPLLTGVWHRQQAVMREFRPDVILAGSDAVHLVLGDRLARQHGVPALLDLYDDYEAFGLTRLPGLKKALRAACARANKVIAVSHVLADLLEMRGTAKRKITVIGNGVPAGFVPDCSSAQARSRLNLPGNDIPLIGTAGALDDARGIRDLFQAFQRLKQDFPGMRLVLAGPRKRYIERVFPQGTIDLGQLPHAQVAVLFRALDVGIICNRDGAFARSCHPMKLMEMIACGLPVVAAAIGETEFLLNEYPHSLYAAGNSANLREKIKAQFENRELLPAGLACSWQQAAEKLNDLLLVSA